MHEPFIQNFLMMKIAILGTRGVPNNYGGFEKAAEEISLRLVERGHDVTVYSPDDHPFRGPQWKGVQIRRVFCHERHLGILGVFLYDFLSLWHVSRSDAQIVLELGPEPAALFFPLFPLQGRALVTNIDGLGWKRSKWSALLRNFVKFCERQAVARSTAVVADNPGMRDYCVAEYGRDATYIPYGAVLPKDSCPSILDKHALVKNGYYLVVARLEPENNIEMVLDGYAMSGSALPMVVVGGLSTAHASQLLGKFKHHSNIRFIGGVYNYEALCELRTSAAIFFHGHSVGGTNPSLLEGMASRAFIAAHDNPFNSSILGEDALYFSSSKEVAEVIKHPKLDRRVAAANNLVKIRDVFSWDAVTEKYEALFKEVLHLSKPSDIRHQ